MKARARLSAESAVQQSPGRKPWEQREIECSPVRAAQVLFRPYRAHFTSYSAPGFQSPLCVLFHPGLRYIAPSALPRAYGLVYTLSVKCVPQ